MQPAILGHERLKQHMIETMKATVSELYKHVKKDEQIVNQIFKEYVHVTDPKVKLNQEWNILEDSKLHREIVYLHNLYNDPDSHARISKISNDAMAMMVFRIEMATALTFALTDAEDEDEVPAVKPAPAPIAAQPAPAPAYNPNNFNHPGCGIIDSSNDQLDGEFEAFKMEIRNEAFQIPEFEPYVMKPMPKEATAVYLKPNQKYKLDERSRDCLIKGNNSNRISIRKYCADIKLEVISHGDIHVHSHCSKIKIDAGLKSHLYIDEDCSDIEIHGFEIESVIHKNCRNITLNGLKIRD